MADRPPSIGEQRTERLAGLTGAVADGARERVREEVEAAEQHNDGQIVVSVEDARALLAASAPVPDAGGGEAYADVPDGYYVVEDADYGERLVRAPAAPPVPDEALPGDGGDALAKWLTAWFERNLTHDRIAGFDNGDWAATLVSDLGEAGFPASPPRPAGVDREALAAVVSRLRARHEEFRALGTQGDEESRRAVSQRGRAAGLRDALDVLAPLLGVTGGGHGD